MGVVGVVGVHEWGVGVRNTWEPGSEGCEIFVGLAIPLFPPK